MSQAALAALLRAVAGGDQAALRELYDRTSAKLFGVCLLAAGDRAAAEEALQDAYLKIWRKAGYFDPARASPIAWMCAIARNAAIDARRARGTLPEPVDDAALAQNNAAAAAHAADQHHLLDCVDGLPPAEARAVRLGFFEGLTHRELALRLAMPLGTLKSLMRRAILALRNCIDD